MIIIIAALAENNAIGRDNRLLWHISGDLKRFKKITTGKTVIMGRNTYLSLPLRPLPERTNVVISDDPEENFEGCVMARSIQDVLDLCPKDRECFIIGGGMVYREFLQYADKLYITRVHKKFEADTYFPEIDPEFWKRVSAEHITDDEQNDFSYSYTVYERKQTGKK